MSALQRSSDSLDTNGFKISPQALRNLQVLVVDDSADVLLLFGQMLERAGAVVTTAESASLALGILQQTHQDVILCDIGMPGVDGYMFIHKLRDLEKATHRSQVPAVALTAYTRDEEKRQALNAGLKVHLAKPVNEKLLLKTLADAAHLSEARA